MIGIYAKRIHQWSCCHYHVLCHEITTQHDSLSQGIRVFNRYRRVLFVFVGSVLFVSLVFFVYFYNLRLSNRITNCFFLFDVG